MCNSSRFHRNMSPKGIKLTGTLRGINTIIAKKYVVKNEKSIVKTNGVLA